ncbi:antitoxin [soil metagenome]
MGFIDKIKSTLSGNAKQAEKVIEKAADLADSKTGGKHSKQIDGAAEKAKDFVEKLDAKK